MERCLSLSGVVNTAVRPGCHSSDSDRKSSSCWEEDLDLLQLGRRCGLPELQEGGLAVDIVVFHVCLRSPVNQDSWGGCDSSHYSAAHISPYELGREVTQPPLFSLEAAPARRRALTCSSKLSSSLLLGPSSGSVSAATPHACSFLA